MAHLRKTKIVCSMGPAIENLSTIKDMLNAGMNVARFNFSHGDHAEHGERVKLVRQASAETGIPVALLLDTKGPEIRTGKLAGGKKLNLEIGHKMILTTEEIEGDADRISISYKALPGEVGPGTHVFIADGLIDLEVEKVDGGEIYCVVRNGGELGSRKNVNVPGVKTSLPAITDKDREDIEYGIKNGFDYIAASFIRKPDDVLEIQQILTDHDSHIRIIAKIEDQEGLDNIDEIIRVAGGVMVARGDLGVQLRFEEIPLAQKRIIAKCNRHNKPVITATQMLDSMINNPNPTRAELTDVANAIFDGTDAVMLSGETANGKYPVKSVETMDRIALAVEQSADYKKLCEQYFFSMREVSSDIGHAVAKSSFLVARDIDATAIVTPTLRGNTPRLLSKFRPLQRIIAVTTDEQAQRQLLLNWGVFPILTEYVRDSDLMIQNALRESLKHKYIKKLDKVVTAAGIPLNSPIPMNTIKVHFMGNILNRGQNALGGSTAGPIVKAESPEQAAVSLKQDGTEILLTRVLTEAFAHVIPNIRGVVIEEGSQIAREELVKLNSDLVVIAEVPEAFQQFEEGLYVSLDGDEKIIYEGVVEA